MPRYKLYNANLNAVLTAEMLICTDSDPGTLGTIGALFSAKEDAEHVQRRMVEPKFEIVEVDL